MVGTVVEYSFKMDSIHFIKILSGEKLFSIYPKSFNEDIRIGMEVEFSIKDNTCYPLNNKY